MKNKYLLFVLLFILGASSFALKTDASKPVEITADHATFDQ